MSERLDGLSDRFVERFPKCPGEHTLMRFVDEIGQPRWVGITDWGRSIFICDLMGFPLFKAPLWKVAAALPYLLVQFAVRSLLGSIWGIPAKNHFTRWFDQLNRQNHVTEQMKDLFQYGTVVNPKPGGKSGK